MGHSEPGSRPSLDMDSADAVVVAFLGSKMWKVNVCCLSHPVYVIFYNSSTNQLTQLSRNIKSLRCYWTCDMISFMNVIRRHKIPGSEYE